MASLIGFGKFIKFYWLIIVSALMKLIINIFFILYYLNLKTISELGNFAIIKYPVLYNHILVYYIYYYFGFFIFSIIFLLRRYLKKIIKLTLKK